MFILVSDIILSFSVAKVVGSSRDSIFFHKVNFLVSKASLWCGVTDYKYGSWTWCSRQESRQAIICPTKAITYPCPLLANLMHNSDFSCLHGLCSKLFTGGGEVCGYGCVCGCFYTGLPHPLLYMGCFSVITESF